MKNDLSKICIMGINKQNDLGCFSLQELIDMGETMQAYRWGMGKIFEITGYVEGDIVNAENVDAIVSLLDTLNYPITRLK